MARQAKGKGSVYQNADGTWVGQCVKGASEKGYLKYKRFTGSTKAEVQQKLNEYIMLMGSGRHCLDGYYLDEYISSWMEYIKKPTLKPSSYDRAMTTITLHINPYIGHYHVNELTPAIIQVELIDALQRKGLSYSSVKKAYVYLNACITFAVNSRQLDYNPCKLVQIQRKLFPEKSIRYFNEKEISDFIAAANTKFDNGAYRFKNRRLLVLDIYTGLRVGELCALKWSDVDFEAATLNVCKNVVTTYNFTNTDAKRKKKTSLVQNSTKSQNRVVPLNKTALSLLREMYDDSKDKAGYIAGGKTPGNVSSMIRSYERICKLAGIPNCRGVHTLRHTFASRLFRKGADIKVISEVLGHTDTGFTYNTYIHLADDQAKNALALLD